MKMVELNPITNQDSEIVRPELVGSEFVGVSVSEEEEEEEVGMAQDDVRCCQPRFYLYLAAIVGLVGFAGLMAGLTLGLMSLGLVDLEVLSKSGRPQDRIHASKILPVVKEQHLLLCTLLIGNSLAMEPLPIFLDKLVPPWAAVLISVTLIDVWGDNASSNLYSLWADCWSNGRSVRSAPSMDILPCCLSNQ